MFKLFRWIRNLLLIAVIVMIGLTLYFFKPVEGNVHTNELKQENTYSLEENALFQNIPKSQIGNAFRFMNKGEFMDVSGLSRMGYNDDYLAGQRGADYIIYKFGDSNVYVYHSEDEMHQALNEKGQNISLEDRTSY